MNVCVWCFFKAIHKNVHSLFLASISPVRLSHSSGLYHRLGQDCIEVTPAVHATTGLFS